MFTSFGFFELPSILFLLGGVLTLLYIVRKEIQQIIRASFLFLSSLLTSLRGHSFAQSVRARTRHQELRRVFNRRNDLAKTLRQLNERDELISALSSDESISRFRLETVTSEARSVLKDLRQHPNDLFALDTIDEADKKQLAAEKSKAIKTWEKSNGRVKELESHFKQLLKLAEVDSSRLSKIQESSVVLNKKIVSLKEAEEQAQKIDPPSRSILVPMILSGIFILGAALGIFANAQLLYFPLTELMGDGEAIRGIKTALAGAIAFIVLEIIAGAIALEGFGVTDWGIFEASGRLGRVIGTLALIALMILAGAEAALVESRASIVQGKAELEAALGITADETAVESGGVENLSRVGQVAFAFVIPFVLALAAMPLRIFLRTTRITLQFIWYHLLAFVAAIASSLRRLLHAIEKIVQGIFLLLIALPRFVVMLVAAIVRMFSKLAPGKRREKNQDESIKHA